MIFFIKKGKNKKMFFLVSFLFSLFGRWSRGGIRDGPWARPSVRASTSYAALRTSSSPPQAATADRRTIPLRLGPSCSAGTPSIQDQID